MVLSNKKLKQKLRAKLADSLISSVAGNASNGAVSGEPSLKVLLGAANPHVPRLSKRAKRRESLILTAPDGKNDEEKKGGENQGLGETKRVKKRKRGEGVKEKSAADGLEEDVEKAKQLNNKKNRKKKKKKKKSHKKANNGEEEKLGGEDGKGVEEGHVEETRDNIGSEVNENVATKGYVGGIPYYSTSIEVIENVATKVYVGGIPYYSTEDDICSFFESCGTITEVDCMKFPETGKFRGIAILSFKTDAAVKRALAMDGADMGGFFLKVQPYKGTRTDKAVDFSPAIMEGYNRIYLGNLSWDVTEDDLKKLFANCTIASIRFGMDKETGEFRGYAHVDFSDSVSLKTALKLDQETIHDRPVKIRCAVPKKGPERGGGPAAAEILLKPPAAAASLPKPPAAAASLPKPPAAAAETLPKPVPEMKEVDSGLSALSGKIRRRTCYECGEKGHLSSNCPAAAAAAAKIHPKPAAAETLPKPPPAVETLPKPVPWKEADSGISALSGKIRRRTCYECGEKGHLSSNCPAAAAKTLPKPPAAAETLPKPPAAVETLPKPVPEMKEADTGLSALSGKIRRRTCYECGEKGHLSSNCPKKQVADSAAS